MGGISERAKEIKRRRHRRKKMQHFSKRLEKASPSERAVMADKLRKMTPGAEEIVVRWGLEER